MSKISKNMISNPTNFNHVAHLEASDVFDMNFAPSSEKSQILQGTLAGISKFTFNSNPELQKTEAETLLDSIFKETEKDLISLPTDFKHLAHINADETEKMISVPRTFQ